MSIESMQLFFALLAVVAAAGTAVAVLALVAGHEQTVAGFAASGPLLAWLVAATATSGSLYLSEIAGYEPCLLCWYQRFAMYPLVVILGFVVWRRSRRVSLTALVLATVGGLVSTYHLLVQRLPALDSGACAIDVPCTGIYVQELGFITIPTMALAGFVTIVVFVAIGLRHPVEVVP